MKWVMWLGTVSILFLSGCGSAIETLQVEAEKGDAQSQYQLGDMYYRGSKDVNKDINRAKHYYNLAAKQGHKDAAYNLALIEEKEENFDQAFKLYKQAAEQGHTYAQTNLGICYKKGRGVAKDLNQAIYWYTKASEGGDIYADRNLAVLYTEEKNLDKAAALYEKIVYSDKQDFKKISFLELMNIAKEQKAYQKAYVWGSLAIISGLFDGKVTDADKYLNDYQAVASKLSEKQRNDALADILLTHYNTITKYTYFLKRHPEFQSNDTVIILESGNAINFTTFITSMNSKNHKRINYLKTKTDTNSQIELALNKLRVASSYIDYGAIVPYYGMAITQLEEASKILNTYDYKNLNLLKKQTGLKLAILQSLKTYQFTLYDKKNKKS